MEIVKPNTITIFKLDTYSYVNEVKELLKSFAKKSPKNGCLSKSETGKHINKLTFDDIENGYFMFTDSPSISNGFNFTNGMTMNNVQIINVVYHHGYSTKPNSITIKRKKYFKEDLVLLARNTKIKRITKKIKIDPELEDKINSIFEEFDIDIKTHQDHAVKALRKITIELAKTRG